MPNDQAELQADRDLFFLKSRNRLVVALLNMVLQKNGLTSAKKELALLMANLILLWVYYRKVHYREN